VVWQSCSGTGVGFWLVFGCMSPVDMIGVCVCVCVCVCRHGGLYAVVQKWTRSYSSRPVAIGCEFLVNNVCPLVTSVYSGKNG